MTAYFFLRPPDLFPCGDRASREDEDDGGDVQRPPDKECQGSSTAPHGGQPWEADKQDGAQRENHTHH